ncbi:nuclear transport factor 2 family protein [Microbacterium sp. X-17]|uniref:nuclear transport factor 2 family protein n=1 Tax=Microbacterium sp. X-17 TaxID=3144404 RepID=UPI0031F5B7E6
MTDETDQDVAAQVTANYLAQCEAMTGADADGLGDLLAPDFTLTHMTGYVQSRREWLGDVESGEMTYHSIRNVDITTDVTAERVSLTARSHTHATIWGAEGNWPLRLRIDYTRTPDGWIASRTVASTW